MIFPIRTDRRLATTPWVNYGLIGMNLGVFLLTLQAGQGVVSSAYSGYWLDPLDPTLAQYLTYQFFHASWMHLIGNMLFLFVFGNAVEDRIGHVGYALFYLAGGVIAGLGHALLSPAPVLGASGAVAAVTGAFLALFPRTYVTLLFFFYFFEVSSMLLILFRIAQDFIFELSGYGRVAYSAHLAGYAFGFAVAMGMLLTRLLPREPYDLISVIEHRRRKSAFRSLTRRGGSPWEKDAGGKTARRDAAPEPTEDERRLMDRRSAIAAALADHRAAEAARLYAELLDDHDDQVMSQPHQLDLANQLMSETRYDRAAAAYELLLKAYPTYAKRHDVKLVLGLIYARYLGRRDRAGELLREAEPSLHGDEKKLAHQVLSELPASA